MLCDALGHRCVQAVVLQRATQSTGATITDDGDERGSSKLLHPQAHGRPITVAATGVDRPCASLGYRSMQTGGGGLTMRGQPTSATVTDNMGERVSCRLRPPPVRWIT